MRSFKDGYAAVVIGASGGVGAAVASQLEADPQCGRVHRLSRTSEPALDLTDEDSVAAAAQAVAAAGGADLVVIASGVLSRHGFAPEKTIRALDPQAMALAFAINAIGPALIFKHFAPLLPRAEKSAIAALSARVGSIGDNRLGGWMSYRASKAALNQIVRTSAIELARTRPQAICLALHPGTVATALSAPFAGARDTLTPEQAAARLLAVIDEAGPEASGSFLAHDGAAIEW